MLPTNDDLHRLIDDYLHGLLDEEAVAEVERRCRAEPECQATLEEARRRLTALQAEPPTEASEELIQATVERIDEVVQARRSWKRRILTGAIGTLAAGVLVLAGLHIYYGTLSASSTDMIVLGQRDLLSNTTSSLRIRLVDSTTKKPLANVPLTVELKERTGGNKVQLASLNTDALGGAEPRFTLPRWEDGEYSLVVTAQTPRGVETINRAVTLKRSWQVMLSSDKPVYQPGQTIRLRSLTLRRPDLKPVGKEKVVFSVSDPNHNVIFKQSAQTNDFGLADADCELASELIEGTYTVVCKVGDTESKREVRVFKYVLPKFKVDVKLERVAAPPTWGVGLTLGFYQPSQTARCTVQADYTFGKPVANADVKVEVRAGGQVLATLPGKTNETGKVELTYKIPDDLLSQEPPPAQPVHGSPAMPPGPQPPEPPRIQESPPGEPGAPPTLINPHPPDGNRPHPEAYRLPAR